MATNTIIYQGVRRKEAGHRDTDQELYPTPSLYLWKGVIQSRHPPFDGVKNVLTIVYLHKRPCPSYVIGQHMTMAIQILGARDTYVSKNKLAKLRRHANRVHFAKIHFG